MDAHEYGESSSRATSHAGKCYCLNDSSRTSLSLACQTFKMETKLLEIESHNEANNWKIIFVIRHFN